VVNNFLDVNERGHSVFRNLILSNTVVKNFGSGISSISSVDGQIIGNTIEDNGLSQLGSFDVRQAFHGIGIQRSFLAVRETRVLVKGNKVNHNGVAGIIVSRGAEQNMIEDNTAINNGAFGIAVLTTNNRIVNNITGNAAEVAGTFDLYDETVGCDNNEWFGNTWGPYTYPGYEGFGSYYPDCTGVGGTGPQPGLEAAFG
jgi:parallel beta-helix repeat protein